ncbi:MAG: dephospho-CoA kinase [Phycisphaerales bacterium]|jgi:dephospho-CoA kinase|nr:dephospho-CoA kinase [Phycisphaerales bacterium]MBT7170725.1 dephospho-CoA kinase [Phycisphaerales bacterium]
MISANESFRVVGLVGGIGAGKSLVAAELESLGLVRIDADRVGHELLTSESVCAAIRERWGDDVFSGDEVNRAALGAVVFAEETQLRELESILHPLMRDVFAARIAEAKQAGAVGVVLDAAVLFEAGWNDLCDATIFVAAPREVRLARVLAERDWTEPQFAAREKRQISLDTKTEFCCYTLDNGSSPSRLTPQVVSLFQTIFS